MSSKNTTIILHDTFLYRGGGERLVMYMRDILDCDLASGFFDPGSYSRSEILANVSGQEPRLIELTRSRIFTKGIRHIKLKFAFLYRTKFLHEYTTIVFSGDCLAAVRNAHPRAKKIFYCHTPPRYIFDKRDWYESQLRKHYGWIYLLVRPLYRWIRAWFERAYRRDIEKMDVIIANSREVAQRISTYFGRQATIIHPPVDIFRFGIAPQSELRKDFFLSFGRLAEFKRVDRIIDAFSQMPDKKLIITYGKNDPIKDELIQQAKGLSNIEFRTNVDDQEAIWLLSNALATIYIPKDEDFGMVPIESMACGTPVIGVDEGGLRETIIHQKTGYLIDPENIVEELCRIVSQIDTKTSSDFSGACRDRAQEFSLDTFATQIGEVFS